MNAELKEQLGNSIVHTGRLLINKVNSRFTATGTNITFEQLDLLLHLATNNGKEIIQNDIATQLNKNKSGILRTIDILEKKEYLRRKPAAGDRRKNVIEVTADGIAVVEEAVEVLNKIEGEYIAKIREEDLMACSKVLDIIKTECITQNKR